MVAIFYLFILRSNILKYMLRAWHLEPSGRYFLEDVQNHTLVDFLFVSVVKNKNIRKKQSTQYYPYNKEKESLFVYQRISLTTMF